MGEPARSKPSKSKKKVTLDYPLTEWSLYQNYTLDLRNYFTPYALPTIQDIRKSLFAAFPDDKGIMLCERRGYLKKAVFDLSFSHPLKNPDAPCIVLPRRRRRESEEEMVNVVLYKSGYEPPTDTLITIVGSALRCSRSIPNSAFDATVSKYGEVLKNTDFQNYRATDVPNGNRYLVLDPLNDTLPYSIDVIHPDTGKKFTFQVQFKGKPWFCHRCKKKHVGNCDARLIEMRRELNI